MFPDITPNFRLSFTLFKGLPTDYKGIIIPGSRSLTASGEQGTMILQEFTAESYNIQFSNFYFFQRIKLLFAPNNAFLQVPFSIRNKFVFKGKEIRNLEIKQDQHAVLHMPGINLEALFEKEKEYQLFDVHYPDKIINELIPSYPQLNSFLYRIKKGKPFIFTKPSKSTGKAKDIVQQILRSPYEKNLQKYFFDKKIKEYLFLIFFHEFSSQSDRIVLDQEETKKMADIEKMLTQNLDQYIPVPDLARKAHMNENKLQAAFKQQFGKNVFEYHREVRLEEAKRLILEERKQIKEVFSIVGYKSITAFITEFKKYFGYTPGSIKK